MFRAVDRALHPAQSRPVFAGGVVLRGPRLGVLEVDQPLLVAERNGGEGRGGGGDEGGAEDGIHHHHAHDGGIHPGGGGKGGQNGLHQDGDDQIVADVGKDEAGRQGGSRT